MKKKTGGVFSNRSVVVMWMTSFFILVAFCAATMLLGYQSAENNIERQLGQLNEDFMAERIAHVDRYISNVINGMLNISNLSEFESVSSIEDVPDRSQRHIASEFCGIMDEVRIEGVTTLMRFVYIPTKNIIIGNGVTRDAKVFFGASSLKGSYEKWEENILNRSNRNMLYYDDENEVVFFRMFHSSKKVYEPESILIIAVEKSDFAEKIGKDSDCDFVISNTRNEQILSVSGRDYNDIIANIDFSSGKQSEVIGDYAVSYERAVGFDWNYVCIADTGIFTDSLRAPRTVVIICVFFAALLSLLMGYYFTKKNNRFVFELFDILKKKNGMGDKNEYAVIYNTVNEIITEINEKDVILYKQSMKRKNDLLKVVLSGETIPSDIEKELRLCGVELEYEYFCVAEIETSKYANIFFEENADEQEALQLAKYIVSNVYEDLFNEELKVYSVEKSTKVVLVINCADVTENIKSDIKKILDFGAAFIEENFNIALKLAVSKIDKGIESISRCYKSIMRAKDYRSVNGSGILDSEDMETGEVSDGYYYYPVKSEQKLVVAIKGSNYSEIEKEIAELFSQNIAKNTTPKFIKIMAMNIVGVFIRTINTSETDINEFFSVFNHTYATIERFESIKEVESSLLVLAEYICRCIDNDEQRFRRNAVDEIKKYVNEHYSDPMLNVNYIAEEFSMKASFLSSLFKKQEKTGLLEYITSMRIDEAKRLLKNSDYTMSVIAEKTGFTSERTFFRAFEKYVGISPGKFRKEGWL